MSKRKKVWLAVALAAALVVLIPLSLRWREQWSLSAYRKKLIASGEKLTVAELAPKKSAQATNTTRFLRPASTLSAFGNYAPTAMLAIKPGVARLAWSQTVCLEEKSDLSKPAMDVWPALSGAGRTNEPTLGEVKAMLDKGGIDFIQDYSRQDLNAFTAYLPATKQLVVALRASAMLALHQGQRQAALEDLKACGAGSELLAKNPLMIDQLVRYACMAVAVGANWEALQDSGWTDEQLDEMQRQWDQPRILADAEASMDMERARAPMEFQTARASRPEMVKDNTEIWNDFLLNARNGIDELITAYPRYWGWRWIWSYRDEQRYLEFMQTMIECTRDAQMARSILPMLKDQNELMPSAQADFDLVAQTISATKRFVGQALRAQTVANIVTTAIALERFRLAHHVYPASLTKLTPVFVKAVPVDCMDGHDLRYRLNPDGSYLLYSVGSDGVDNGGDPTPETGKTLGFRNGRDWVWPRPATAEEMGAYEVEQSKPKNKK